MRRELLKLDLDSNIILSVFMSNKHKYAIKLRGYSNGNWQYGVPKIRIKSEPQSEDKKGF